MEKVLYSTSELLFSNRSFWFKTDNAWVEEKSILHAMTREKIQVDSHSYFERITKKSLKDFLESNFWKYFSRRIWQKDDFKFKSIAAAFYIKTASRYKVKFNPFRFYELYISSILSSQMTKEETELYLNKLKEALEKDEDITTSFDGIDFSILKMLYKCFQAGKWDEPSWKEWNNFLLKDLDVLRDLVSVFIHEYLHIILNHVSTRIEDRNMKQWNYATDFAINQSCIFNKNLRKTLITTDNRKFMDSFLVATVSYLYKNNESFANDVDKRVKIYHDDVYNCVKENYHKIVDDRQTLISSILGHSADEYYRILSEIPQDPNDKDNSEDGEYDGYDDHMSWGENDETDEEMDGDSNEGDEDDEEDSDESDENEAKQTKPDNQSTERGREFSGKQTHNGFDALTGADKRSEARNAIKDSLMKSGIDTNDFNELQKGLNSIPGLNSHGGLIANFFKVKTKSWKQMLQNFMTCAVNVSEADYTMSRESRIRADIYPGKKLDRGLDCILAMDTSGSICGPDWNDFCNQIQRISRDFNATELRVIQCHTRVSFDEKVNISKINKMQIKETGGTIMQVIFEKLKKEKNRKPVILFTDGEIDHFKASDYGFKILMFISRGHSYCKPMLESLGHTVICQDEE